MEISRYTELFLSEAREHISSINRLLLGLERRPQDRAAVDELFRAAHTLKGMAGAMGYGATAELSHGLEHLLEALRAGTLAVDAAVVDLLLEAADALERSVEREAGGAADVADAALLERLQSRSAMEAGPAEPDAPDSARAAEEGSGPAAQVVVRFDPSAPLPAVRAVMALRVARDLGTVSAVLPDEAQLMAGELDGSLSFALRTSASPEVVRAAIEAVGEVAGVEVRGATAAPAAEARGAIVRVRQARLDALVDQLGELVIARDRLERAAGLVDDAELEESVAALTRLIGGLREDVMRLRAVAVGEVFDRFPRLVRDAARALDKRVALEMEGQEEELDRSLLNELGDLLVHLLRNAVDHGIESPEERRAAGKPESGMIRLTARRRRSAVVVRVEDDGRGLRRERIERAAVERGLLTAEQAAALSPSEVWGLISMPGFSTAERVTDVSGRGVGLDVVSARVQALGGSVEVQSEPGRGTTFEIRLPLTLAITRVLLAGAADEVYALPVAAVVEVCEFLDGEVERTGENEYLSRGGARLRLVRLDRLVEPPRSAHSPSDAPTPAIVVEGSDGPVTLAVDVLLGQREAVVKPFDATLQMKQLFSGAMLLSDGHPCLILEPSRLASSGADAEMANSRSAL